MRTVLEALELTHSGSLRGRYFIGSSRCQVSRNRSSSSKPDRFLVRNPQLKTGEPPSIISNRMDNYIGPNFVPSLRTRHALASKRRLELQAGAPLLGPRLSVLASVRSKLLPTISTAS